MSGCLRTDIWKRHTLKHTQKKKNEGEKYVIPKSSWSHYFFLSTKMEDEIHESRMESLNGQPKHRNLEAFSFFFGCAFTAESKHWQHLALLDRSVSMLSVLWSLFDKQWVRQAVWHSVCFNCNSFSFTFHFIIPSAQTTTTLFYLEQWQVTH